MRTFVSLLSIFFVLLYLTLVVPFSSAQIDANVTGNLGDPLPGLSPGDLVSFDIGRQVFLKRFKRIEGLGPHFNAVSCKSCHEDPDVGGSSERYRDFFLAAETKMDGTQGKIHEDCTEANILTHKTEICLPSVVVPSYGPPGTISAPVAASVERATIPPQTEVVARRNAPPIFGVGLFRLVEDSEILSRADPDDGDADGISGRVNRIAAEDNSIGRFGYKCQTASIESFNRGALQNQMGITSNSTEFVVADSRSLDEESLLDELFHMKVAHAQVAVPKDRITDFDGVMDPEITRVQLLDLIFFQENLAAPRRGRITPAVTRGEAVFEAIGCNACHVRSLSIPEGDIHPYTDLLIHDMGPGLADGIEMAEATGSEFRTQPLWGLCQHAPFLHDGRADSLEQAVLEHGGEAENARVEYQGLGSQDQEDLHRFLESL